MKTLEMSRRSSTHCRAILAADSLRAVVSAIVEAKARGRAIIWGFGGHVIKTGLAPILVDLMRRGFVTAFATNGSGVIHDFEIALAGSTSEDVDSTLGVRRVWHGRRDRPFTQ